VLAQILACGVMGVDVSHARDPRAVAAAVQAIRYPFNYPGARKARTDLPYDGEGLRGSGSQGFATRIWGVIPTAIAAWPTCGRSTPMARLCSA
jgi:shikimate 5-dehydrogenase